MIILSAEAGKESSQALAAALGVKWENPFDTDNRDFRQYNKVFKYGFSRPIKAKKGATYNGVEATDKARDKLKTLNLFKDSKFGIPYTQDKYLASKWIKSGVVARNKVMGKNGDGVAFCFTVKHFDESPAIFWTKYIEHTNEFRVNLWRDKVVSVYDKVDKNGIFNFKLFKGVEEHPQLVELAKEVYEKIGLDFCGVDVVRDKKGNLHLLEVNSAPVLYPYTLKKLVTILKKEII